MSRSIDLAVADGDGIGQEVVPEALKVLDVVQGKHGFTTQRTAYELGWRMYDRLGEVLPDSVIDELKGHDAILFGAVGDPRVPPGLLERGMLLKLRFRLDHHINLRPIKLYPGMSTPVAGLTSERCDIVVVREGTEGPYVGAGGSIRTGTKHEVATEESINTAYGVERVVRDGFERAMRRRKKLTLVHKSNVLVHAGAMWQRIVNEVATEYPDVAVDYQHVDAASMFFITAPQKYDVIVTDNLFGDVITDVGAAVAGGIGLAASGSIDGSRTNPSMFEPVHGSAPDIAGQGIADPTACVLSLALLLDHVGEPEAAATVEAAVAADLAVRSTLGQRSTAQIGDAIAAHADALA
jgi:3-isopropylmalate dehydrogenase